MLATAAWTWASSFPESVCGTPRSLGAGGLTRERES